MNYNVSDMVLKVCGICNAPFRQVKRGRRRYCSPRCAKEAEGRKKNWLNDTCPQCGKVKTKSARGCRHCYALWNRGANHPSWKGGKVIQKGYIHVRVSASRYSPEHRVVWEQTHDKRLPKNWVIHHINGNRADNRPENLVAMPRKQHTTSALLYIAEKRIRELEQLRMNI